MVHIDYKGKMTSQTFLFYLLLLLFFKAPKGRHTFIDTRLFFTALDEREYLMDNFC